MHWTDIPAGDINAATQRLLVALGDNADKVIADLKKKPNFVTTVANFMVNGGHQPTTSQKSARTIMGGNMFGIEEAIKHFGITPSATQLLMLSQVPFSAKVLKACKDTHILVAVFPLSILDLRRKVDPALFYSKDGDGWYQKQAFAKSEGKIGWKLIRKTPVDDSIEKNWDEQQALLGKDEMTPSAQVMTYAIIGHFLATEERLFESIYVRTSDVDSDGSRVLLGEFDATGLFVDNDWDSFRYGNLGLAGAWKSAES